MRIKKLHVQVTLDGLIILEPRKEVRRQGIRRRPRAGILHFECVFSNYEFSGL
jgi:hypothetical protein